MRHLPLIAFLLLPPVAHAAWPEDVVVSNLPTFEGEPVRDPALLSSSLEELVTDIGTLVANKPLTPAGTLGWAGAEVDLSAQAHLTEAQSRGDTVGPWTRTHPDEDNAAFHLSPALSIRKGLPYSTEVGATMGWIGGSTTGFVGGWGRVAIVEGYKPAPDIAVKVGYSGYVGNPELDVGVFDVSLTVGSSWAVGSKAGVHTGRVAPWVSLGLLRIAANAQLDDATQDAIGTTRFGRGGNDEHSAGGITAQQVGAGVQWVSTDVLIKIAATWSPQTVPTITMGTGFQF